MVARVGGQENAFTSNDYTAFYQRVPSEQLKTVMDFEADRMTGLKLTDEVVLPERNVILEEENMRIENNPRARLGIQIDARAVPQPPLWQADHRLAPRDGGTTRDDAIGFYRRFYAPNDAVVVVAGDVDPAEALKFAEATYGKVPRHGNILQPQPRRRPPPAAARSLTLVDPRVEQPVVQREYLVPSFHTAKAGQSEALEVLANIVGGGTNSRLYRVLVVDKRVAVSAQAWYDSAAYDMSKFGLVVAPRPGVALLQLEADADAVLADVVANGVTAAELDRAKSRMIADAVYAQDNQVSMARWYGSALTTGGTVADVRRWRSASAPSRSTTSTPPRGSGSTSGARSPASW